MANISDQIRAEITQYALEPYLLELESNGLTIVPPEVTGVTDALLDRCTEVLLEEFTRMTGCPISLENGPEGELEWPDGTDRIMASVGLPPEPKPSVMLMQQLLQRDRCFRDLLTNPQVDALVSSLIQGGFPVEFPFRMRRLDNSTSYLKWQSTPPAEGQTGFSRPGSIALHPDQRGCPMPWGGNALYVNATWMLTPYSKEDGCLAYVPRSHLAGGYPGPDADARAVPAEGPRGAVVLWHGATWHGSFPKRTPGLRLNAIGFYRHFSISPQENLQMTIPDGMWEDCAEPRRLREMLGIRDVFPYREQMMPVPRLVGAHPPRD